VLSATGFQVIDSAVSRDGGRWARTFAIGDLDQGGTAWVTQIGDGRAVWFARIHGLRGFSDDGDLLYAVGRRLGRYDIETRRAAWVRGAQPLVATLGRWQPGYDEHILTVLDTRTGSRRQWPLELPNSYLSSLVGRWAVIEEQVGTETPTSSGRHVVFDLKTGWYTVCDSIDPAHPPTPPEAPGPVLAGHFDPDVVRWAAHGGIQPDELRGTRGLWSAAIDGSGLTWLADQTYGPVAPLADGRALFVPLDDPEQSHGDLAVASAGGVENLGFIRLPFLVQPHDDALYAWTSGTDAHPVRIPLDGTAEIPITGVPSRTIRQGIVASATGTRIAVGGCTGNVAVRINGSWRTLRVRDSPMGFDAGNQLIYREGCGTTGAVRRDVRSGPDPELLPAGGSVRMTSDGRWVIGSTAEGDGRTTLVTARSLTSKLARTWSLVGAWDLTQLGTDRYAVLVGVAPYWQWHIVIDLEEGSYGFLPPINPPQ
jgi:hypothetical protein